MDKNWSYEENPFLNATEHSYELMYKINEFHYNALLANSSIPFMVERIALYTPFHNDYEAKYTAWVNSGGTQKSETLTVDQLLALTVQKLNGWEPLINIQFPKGSPGYMKLFPRGRYPLTTGAKDQRIAAFATLGKALENNAPLSAVHTDVQAYWQQLHDARSMQQQSKTGTGTGSDALEAARVAACDAMYENLGNIMAFYSKDRHRIGSFFDLENIRNHQQVIFQKQVKPQHTAFIVKHTFAADDSITFINNGDTPLWFYLGTAEDSAFSEINSVQVAVGATQTVSASLLGAPDKAFLLIYNPDEKSAGEGEVHFL